MADGLLFGNPARLGIPATAVTAAILYSGVVSFILLKVIGAEIPLRAADGDQTLGLDMSMHGEEAYTHTGGATQVL